MKQGNTCTTLVTLEWISMMLQWCLPHVTTALAMALKFILRWELPIKVVLQYNTRGLESYFRQKCDITMLQRNLQQSSNMQLQLSMQHSIDISRLSYLWKWPHPLWQWNLHSSLTHSTRTSTQVHSTLTPWEQLMAVCGTLNKCHE